MLWAQHTVLILRHSSTFQASASSGTTGAAQEQQQNTAEQFVTNVFKMYLCLVCVLLYMRFKDQVVMSYLISEAVYKKELKWF